MNLFQLNEEEFLTFFAVLVRFSVLIAVLPFFGDRLIPTSAKVLFSLAITLALYPTLVRTGQVRPGEALFWGHSLMGLVGTVFSEALFGFVLGYSAKLLFDGINFGANLAGSFMGFATASLYDPHQETQTQVIAEFQLAIAMLLFLILDGHHLMLTAALKSYEMIGLGQAGVTALLTQKLISQTKEIISFGVQMAAPMAISLFSVNIVFGILAKSMPQLNILVLSFSVSIGVGFLVLLFSVPEFQLASQNILERVGDWMESVAISMKT